jgi:hypothetical protein
MKHVIELDYYKSTKHTHVYKTEDRTQAVQSVYVKRESLPIAPPTSIKLTVEYDD